MNTLLSHIYMSFTHSVATGVQCALFGKPCTGYNRLYVDCSFTDTVLHAKIVEFTLFVDFLSHAIKHITCQNYAQFFTGHFEHNDKISGDSHVTPQLVADFRGGCTRSLIASRAPFSSMHAHATHLNPLSQHLL